MATNVTLTPGLLPQGYCFTSLQSYYNDIIALTLAQIPGTYSLFNFGSNLPDPADQDKPWVRTSADGTLDGLYTYNGVWCRPHPTPYSGSERRMWVGTEEALWAYDGGDGSDPSTSPPTDTTGAMWVVDTTFAFKMPLGVGTNATTYDGNPASSVAVTGTGGAERHTLTEAELAAHDHFLANQDMSGASSGSVLSGTNYLAANSDSEGSTAGYWLRGTATLPTTGLSSETGSGTSHQNMPPYVGVYFIKRSARKYITVT